MVSHNPTKPVICQNTSNLDHQTPTEGSGGIRLGFFFLRNKRSFLTTLLSSKISRWALVCSIVYEYVTYTSHIKKIKYIYSHKTFNSSKVLLKLNK